MNFKLPTPENKKSIWGSVLRLYATQEKESGDNRKAKILLFPEPKLSPLSRMSVPTHEELKAPALQIFNDGKEHSLTELFGTLGDHFNVSEAERKERLPSGRQSRFLYRLYWCCYDLYRAGLLTRPRKGVYLITDVGRQVAGKKLDFIDRKYLMQFPSFAEFQNKTHANGSEQESVPHKATSTQTPEDTPSNMQRFADLSQIEGINVNPHGTEKP